MEPIRVGIVGVGNCASSLVQGLDYFRKLRNEAVGLPFDSLGGYTPRDIEVSCAFDVDSRKVGRDISEAIFCEPNCTEKFWPQVSSKDVAVMRGKTLDGVASNMATAPAERAFRVSDQAEPSEDEVVRYIQKSATHVIINFLPVGSQEASEFYAQCSLRAGAAFINAIPVFLAGNEVWREKFRASGLPILGDDFKAQIGATIVQRAISRLFDMRGAKLDRSYQLNVGGNTDFLNMMNAERLTSKRHSKTEAVQSVLNERLKSEDIRIGPSDYVPWLKDRKTAHMRLEGRVFGGSPVNIEVRLDVEDSPNAAAMALTAIRCARIAMDRNLSGSIDEVNGYLFKSPPKTCLDEDAYERLLAFTEGTS